MRSYDICYHLVSRLSHAEKFALSLARAREPTLSFFFTLAFSFLSLFFFPTFFSVSPLSRRAYRHYSIIPPCFLLSFSSTSTLSLSPLSKTRRAPRGRLSIAALIAQRGKAHRYARIGPMHSRVRPPLCRGKTGGGAALVDSSEPLPRGFSRRAYYAPACKYIVRLIAVQ